MTFYKIMNIKTKYMNKIRLLLALVISVMIVGQLWSQSAVYQWKTQLSYSEGVTVAETAERVYFAPTTGLMYYNKLDNSLNTMSKDSGLSDLNVSILRANSTTGTLFIGYSNANIDMIKGNVIINIPDIKNKEIAANKVINEIYFNGNLAYVCTGFGIVVVDIDREEVKDTYFIGENGAYVNVLSMTSDDQYLYASTDKGIYRADITSNTLFLSSSWMRVVELGRYSNIANFGGKIITTLGSTLVENPLDEFYELHSDSVLTPIMEDEIFGRVYRVIVANGKLLIPASTKVRVYNEDWQLTCTPWESTWSFPVDMTMSADGSYYVATSLTGLVKCSCDGKTVKYLLPNGPGSNKVFAMSSYKDQIWVASGGYSSTMANLYNNNGAYSYISDAWKTYSPSPNLPGHDYTCVAVSPLDPKRVYIGTYGVGVLELYDGKFVKLYDDTNSTLQKRLSLYGICVTGLAFDENGDLWVTISESLNPLHVMRKSGTWEIANSTGLPSFVATGGLVIDKKSQKWIITQRNDNSVLVFNAAGTEGKQLTGATGNGALNGGRYVSIAIDNNGEAWLGSDNGVYIISNPGNIFRSGANYDAKRIVYDGRYLFENTLIKSIAIDGENKKWIGTDRSGAYLISADGKDEIYAFSTKDSPLISDNIIAIAINAQGEVFFGTESGIISFKDNTRPIDPEEQDFKLKVYPNPVTPDYLGYIAIDNLPANGSVKITDAGGRMVCSMKAQGTRAVWDGNNLEGKRAATGVYFIQAVGEDTKQKSKGKIVFIN